MDDAGGWHVPRWCRYIEAQFPMCSGMQIRSQSPCVAMSWCYNDGDPEFAPACYATDMDILHDDPRGTIALR